MTTLEQHAKVLKAFTSKDETRYALTGLVLIKGRIWATDGHRLFSSELAPTYKTEREGSCIDADFYLKNLAIAQLDHKFPTLTHVIPDMAGYKSFTWKIPEWFAKIARVKSKHACISLMPSGYFIVGSDKEALFSFDAPLISPLIELDAEIDFFYKDKKSPMLIGPAYEGTKREKRKVTNREWFAVIMPLRVDIDTYKVTFEVVETPQEQEERERAEYRKNNEAEIKKLELVKSAKTYQEGITA